MYQLCGTWTATDCVERTEEFQAPKALWNQFSVPGHAGKHCAALCVCAGPGLLGKTVWKTSYGTGSCGNLF